METVLLPAGGSHRDDHAEGTKGRKRPTDVIDTAIIDAGEGEPKRC
jgi:hypothetical protein